MTDALTRQCTVVVPDRSDLVADQSPTDVGGLGRLAGWCYDRRRSVLIGWMFLLWRKIFCGSYRPLMTPSLR